MLAAVQFVDDIESSRLFLHVIHRVAALLRRRVRVLLLRILLNRVAGVAACTRAGHGWQGLAASAADLMPQHAADQGADSGANQTVLIFDGLGVRNLFVVAFLSRNLDRSREWLCAHDIGRMGSLVRVVAGNGTARDHHSRSGKRSRHKRNFHCCLQITFNHSFAVNRMMLRAIIPPSKVRHHCLHRTTATGESEGITSGYDPAGLPQALLRATRRTLMTAALMSSIPGRSSAAPGMPRHGELDGCTVR